jgi:hypothetical protein
MISEEDLLKSVIEGIEQCTTLHYAIIDSKQCKKFSEKTLKNRLNNKKIAWLEPKKGVYIINTLILLHFKQDCNSISSLFQSLINCGYLISSKRFITPKPAPGINLNKKTVGHLAIVTMFSSKASITIWENVLKKIHLPPKIKVDVLMGDNSESDLIFNLYKKIKRKYRNKFNAFYIHQLGKKYHHKIHEHYLEINKHIHVANKYSEFLKEPVKYYNYILKIEDDIEPPELGLIDLYNNMKRLEKENKVSCVAGYYPQKLNSETACISLQAKIWGRIPKIDEIPKKLFQVEMQGGGFALYKSKALKEVLPYKLTFKIPNGQYYMTGWDGTIGEEWANSGWKQYCDGNLFCKHYF